MFDHQQAAAVANIVQNTLNSLVTEVLKNLSYENKIVVFKSSPTGIQYFKMSSGIGCFLLGNGYSLL